MVKVMLCKKYHMSLSASLLTAILLALKDWQIANNKLENERPPLTSWYYKLRVELIDQKLLSQVNSWDTCRNCIINHLKKVAKEAVEAAAKADAAAKASEANDID